MGKELRGDLQSTEKKLSEANSKSGVTENQSYVGSREVSLPGTSVLQPHLTAFRCFSAYERGLRQQVAQLWKATFKTGPNHHKV